MARDRPSQRRVRTLIILGASGDLTARQLLPGLATLLAEEPAGGLIVAGAGWTDWDDERWRERIAQSFAAAGTGPGTTAEVMQHAVYRRADVTSGAELASLLELGGRPIAIYFALPPAVTWEACCALRDRRPADTHLVLEAAPASA
jgi:glucose-6-phosphate 1-dehydrogenase